MILKILIKNCIIFLVYICSLMSENISQWIYDNQITINFYSLISLLPNKIFKNLCALFFFKYVKNVIRLKMLNLF